MSYDNSKNRAPAGPPAMRNALAGKAKNFKKSWANLISYTKPYHTPVIFAVLFSVVTTLITLYGASLISDITNLISVGLFGNINVNKIISISICLAILYFLSLLLNYFSGFIMVSVTRKLSKTLRKDISRKINIVPLGLIDRSGHGDLLSRITNDVDTISQSLDQSIVTLVSSSILLIGSLIMMFINSWILALCAIAASILGFILTSIILKKSQKYFIQQQQTLGELNGHIEEVYGGHSIVKVYNAEEQATQKFTKINNNLYNSSWKSQYLSGLMMPIMNFVGSLGFVIVCVVGSVLHLKGSIGIGTIAAFILYIKYFSQPLSQLAQIATSLQSTAAASERVFEILNLEELPSEEHKTTKIQNCSGKVEFRNVKFSYDKKRTIIKDFSTIVQPGQKVAIVGPTGAGKTTLVNLIMRFYELDSGEILIDDINIQDISRENLHNLFSMVLQDTWIFNGSIKDNITYSKQNVLEDEIVSACKAVGLHHFIKTLPNGYDTILDENTTISAGQKQLLTIARAMIQNCPMLILDEATSSVDTRLEILIQEAMDNLTKNRTSFVIAHRLSTIKNADLILVMRDGDIIESGNHHDLLEKNGFYAELYNSQFEEQ